MIAYILLVAIMSIPIMAAYADDNNNDFMDLMKELPEGFTFSMAPSVQNTISPYEGSVEQHIILGFEKAHEADTLWLLTYQEHEARGEKISKLKKHFQSLGAANEMFATRAGEALLSTPTGPPLSGGSPENPTDPAIFILKGLIKDTAFNIKEFFAVSFGLLKTAMAWDYDIKMKDSAEIAAPTPEELKEMRDSFNTLGDPVLISISEKKACTITMEGPEHISRHITYPLYGTTMHEQKLKWIPCEGSAFVIINDDLLWRYGENQPNAFEIMAEYDSYPDGEINILDPIWDGVRLMDHRGAMHQPSEFNIIGLSYKYKALPNDGNGEGSYFDKFYPDSEHFRGNAISFDGVRYSDGTVKRSFATPQAAISDCSTYDAKYFYAEGYMLNGMYEEAMAGYKEVTERCPHVSHGIAGVASILHRVGFYDLALEGYGEALRIDDYKNYHYITDVGEIYYLLEDLDTARILLEYSHSLNPDFAWTNTMMGKVGM